VSTALAEHLIKLGALERDGLELAIEVQKRNRRRLDDVLRAMRLVPSAVLAKALADLGRYPYADPAELQTATLWDEAAQALGVGWCRQYDVAPCVWNARETFLLAYPFHLSEIDRLRQQWPAAVYCVTTPELIHRVLAAQRAGSEQQISESIKAVEARGVESGSVPNVLRALINLALDRHASDLHIEPSRDTVVVRCRVDGLLQPLQAISRQYYMNVVNVLWEWAELPHGNTLEVLDGHFRHECASGEIDIRLSAIPGQDGPSIVLRLLSQDRASLQLEDLGYTPGREAAISELLRVPYGLLLVTGPTGSGKSTTLYAILNRVNSQQVKIVTVEDPVEVRLARVQQVPLHEATGVTFGSVTRAFLRHDPDIIMIGEIRDQETAREAIRAALTGRKVLSTLHTQNSLGAIPRLLELGVEPGLLAETLVGVVAQRLVRLRCPACRRAGTTLPDCSACRGTGEAGRTILSEVLSITPRFRGLIEREPTSEQLRQLAEAERFSTMADDALTLIGSGRITIEEVERVLGPLHVEAPVEDTRV
jgi:general secretion pathway protein E